MYTWLNRPDGQPIALSIEACVQVTAVLLALLDPPPADEDSDQQGDEELAGIAFAALSVLLQDEQLLGTAGCGAWFQMIAPALSVDAVLETARQLEPYVLKDVLFAAWKAARVSDQLQADDPPLPKSRAAKVFTDAAPFAVHLAECILKDSTSSGRLTPNVYIQQLLFVTSTATHASEILCFGTAPSASRHEVPLLISKANSLLHATVSLQKMVLIAVDVGKQQPAVQLPEFFSRDASRGVQTTGASVVSLGRFLATAQRPGQQYTADSVAAGSSTAGVLTASQGQNVLDAMLVMMKPERSGLYKHDYRPLHQLLEDASQPSFSVLTATAEVVSPTQLASLHEHVQDVCNVLEEAIGHRWQSSHLSLLTLLVKVFDAILRGLPSIGGGPFVQPHVCTSLPCVCVRLCLRVCVSLPMSVSISVTVSVFVCVYVFLHVAIKAEDGLNRVGRSMSGTIIWGCHSVGNCNFVILSWRGSGWIWKPRTARTSCSHS